jgi:hypothetical protein
MRTPASAPASAPANEAVISRTTGTWITDAVTGCVVVTAEGRALAIIPGSVLVTTLAIPVLVSTALIVVVTEAVAATADPKIVTRHLFPFAQVRLAQSSK